MPTKHPSVLLVPSQDAVADFPPAPVEEIESKVTRRTRSVDSMSCGRKRSLHIYFGSQTGTAMGFASTLEVEATRRGNLSHSCLVVHQSDECNADIFQV